MTELSPDIGKSNAPLRMLLVVVLFTVIGPPIGGIVAWLFMGAASVLSPVPFILGSYMEGLPLAALAGVYVAGSWWLFGRTSFVAPIIGAILANLVFHGATMTTTPDSDSVSRLAYVFLPGSIVAAVICWLLAKRLVR